MAKQKIIKGTVGEKTVEYKEMSMKEAFVVFITTLVGFSFPTAIIAFVLVKITELNIFTSVVIGLLMIILLVVLFGWHKPAYENGKKSDEDDDD
ncbi:MULTISPECIES: hypothetical protein [unclassified Bacillus cereus group]|uniref:hypothetical protein n=1 Tax=unclassified Bacillus cereus group TaxID=2750818 RepID=UPI001F55AEBE|nr:MULTISPECIES: hypothetical protein [unclassified Bacillus cereus group]